MLLTLLIALAPAAPSDTAPRFTAYSRAEERPTGALIKLYADGSAELATDGVQRMVRDLISLRRTRLPLPPLPRGPVMITTSGDRIPGTLTGGDDQSLRFKPTFSKSEWDVPFTAVSLIWLTQPPADTPMDPARYTWLPANRNRDILRFRNGDTTTGTIETLSPDKEELRFKPEAGESRSFAFSELSAIAFNPTLARARKVKGPYSRLVLRDGTRLGATNPTADVAALKGRTLFGQVVEVPIADVVSIDVMQGKATYLADLKPAKAESAGFLGVSWNWTANRNVHGEPLRILTAEGESTHDRGLGTHPKTTLTYDLGGKYRRFEALVGLDAASGQRGRAAVRILVDGKEQALPELHKLAAGPATSLQVDVAGAKQLIIVVDFGPAGDVQADVNWADARLVE
jgi:hypothetical protein